MHILLTDDDEEVLKVIGRFLVARGHRLRTASNGPRALQQIEEQPPDLVLCDFQMPRMDGIELLHTVRERFPAISVILMTGDRDIDTAIAAFRGGAHDFLKKPVRLEELLGCLRKIEGRNRQEA